MNTKQLLTVVIILLVILGGIGGFFLATKINTLRPQSESASVDSSVISGTIDLDGAMPPGATISIAQRPVGQQTFTTVVTDIPAVDKSPWHWDNATAGTAYELQAMVVQNGNTIQTSKIVTTDVAPSTSATIRIVSTYQPPQPAKVSISGTFDLNGYIPPNSTINVMARKVGDSSFSAVASDIAAIDNGVWSWTSATSGSSYEIQGVLQQNGQTITSSQVQTLTAPAANETITINSTATAPAPVVPAAPVARAISGTININGNIPGGATVSIGTRPTGSGSFKQVANGLSASNGMTWSWNGGSAGATYDIQAYLWVNNQPSSQSQILTVAAPAANEVLTINAQTQPTTPPNNSINASCGSAQQGSMRQVTINYNTQNNIPNVQSYLVTIGTSSNANNTLSSTISPNNPNSSQTMTTGFILNAGSTYYIQYAYATCTNCNTFSSFSPSISVLCN